MVRVKTSLVSTWFSLRSMWFGLDGKDMQGSHRSVIISRYGYCIADLQRMLSSDCVLTFVICGGLFSISLFSGISLVKVFWSLSFVFDLIIFSDCTFESILDLIVDCVIRLRFFTFLEDLVPTA